MLLCLALSTWVAAGPTPAVVSDMAELLQSTLQVPMEGVWKRE